MHQNITFHKDNQTDKQIQDWLRKNAKDSDIHIPMYHQKSDLKSLLPFEINGSTIHIIIDDTVLVSPLLENNKIKIWLEDNKSPLLIKMLMERLDSFRC